MMHRKSFNLFIISLFVIAAQSQDLSIFTLPSKITDNANAVVNYDELSIDLVRQNNMIIHRKASITVFNKKANNLAELSLHYNKSVSIKSVKMEFFNLLGKRIKKVKKRDFKDYSATDNGTLYSDSRVLYYNHTATTYPYTVVFEYKIQTSNTAFIPKWKPIFSEHLGIKKSTFSFKYPVDFKIQKLEANFENYNIKKTESPGVISYSMTDIPAYKHEYLSPSPLKILPYVKLASNRFHIEGIDGFANNWTDFGKWMHNKLLASRNNLSLETVNKIKEMVKGVSDPTERAKIIYDYVQNKTRYISIQVEIGGWQPMLTDDVDKLGYGDCKALTFYTKSLMDVAEIPSFYTLVFSGEEKDNIENDIVSMQGDHAFLCLPREKDTIWLECTSQKVPFGFKNSFTDDRDVLAITPDGGKIIHTSTNLPKENLQETTANLSIDINGTLKGSVEVISYGLQYSDHLNQFDGLSYIETEKQMRNHISFVNNLDFKKIETTNNKDKKRYEESFYFKADNYAIINADQSILFSLNALNRISYVPEKVQNRKTAFVINRGYKDIDFYTIDIPKSYSLPKLPKPLLIKNKFGSYSLILEKKSDSSFVYKREILINRGFYNKELYEDYRKFRKQIKKLENKKIILNKK